MLIFDDKLIEIFIECDDFCKEFNPLFERLLLPKSKYASRKPTIAESEMMTILILYHLSGSKCFQYFYEQVIWKRLKSYFPAAPSYHRFVELQKRVCFHLFCFLHSWRKGNENGVYYVDSKKLPACDNRRIHQHRVFDGIAQRGKTSTGWFFGLKLFLVINAHGEIIRATVAPGNVADNNFEFITRFFKQLKGVIYGDKGFLSGKIFEHCWERGAKVITKIKQNMKNKLMEIEQKLFLNKRGVIESVFDLLMTICDIDHTRHRSPQNAITNLFAGLVAFSYFERKPSIFVK